MTFFSISNDSHFEMICDYPFDRATVSLRPHVIKKLLPEPAQEVAYVKAKTFFSIFQRINKTKQRVNVNGDTMP